MVYACIAKGCGSKPKKWSRVRFHIFPTSNKNRMKEWMCVLDIDPDTPAKMLRKMFVCSNHFLPEDYYERMEDRSSGMVHTLFLKETAVPSVGVTGGNEVSVCVCVCFTHQRLCCASILTNAGLQLRWPRHFSTKSNFAKVIQKPGYCLFPMRPLSCNSAITRKTFLFYVCFIYPKLFKLTLLKY